MSRKANANAKLKSLPEEAQEALWALLTEPQVPMDDEGSMRPYTLQELQAEVPLRHGFTVALSTVSEWRSWYALKRRAERAKARVQQAQLEWLQKNPDTTPEELERLGQILFTSESIEEGNAKAFVALRKISQKDKQIAQDDRRIKLLERKEERHDAAEALAGDDEITAEEKQERLKAIFGIG